jgi:CRISPR/Cas system-associated exonuclease Cas4 (RecB family)
MPGIKISGNAIVDYSGYNDDILNMLAERLEPLFDKDEPFRPSPNSSHCKFCNFSMICGQKV